MLQLFNPTHKVQKDRKLMHDTDSRIAKYSRRGLVLNFLVFALCLYFGNFFQNEQGLAIFLITGLLLVTLLRSYFLFRFESHYARAPARWRKQYFLVSFLGAIWWSIILVSLTWELGMHDETLIMWLYSVVFYSSVANVFAPYRRFLSYYLFIGQIPAAITAMLLGTADGLLYGIIMMMFYYMLHHQGKVTAKAYWERLEANYALREHAKGLEGERLDSQAAIELKNEFLVNIGNEFRASLNDVLGPLSIIDDGSLTPQQQNLLQLASKAGERQLDLINNVADYAKISSHQLMLDRSVFNLRRNLEILVEDLATEAAHQGVELNYIFDLDMPARVSGDAIRMSQILGNLLSHAINFSELGQVIFQASYQYDAEGTGYLNVVIRDEGRLVQSAVDEDNAALAVSDSPPRASLNENPNATVSEEPSKESKNKVSQVPSLESTNEQSLNLTICRALAECMGGGVQIIDQPSGQETVITLHLDATGKQLQHLAANPKMQGKRILLIDAPQQVLESARAELEEWGLQVTATTIAEAKALLLERLDSEKSVDIILAYASEKSHALVDLSQSLTESPELENVKQIIIYGVNQIDRKALQEHINTQKNLRGLGKPASHQSVYDALNALLFNIDADADSSTKTKIELSAQGEGKNVLLVDDHRVNQMVAEGMLKKLGYQVFLASNGREAVVMWQQQDEQSKFDLVMMDCQMPELDGYGATREIRQIESRQGDDRHVPIVAMTAHAGEGDQARCLAAGMDDYLVKPIRLGELQLRLKRWLGGRSYQAKER